MDEAEKKAYIFGTIFTLSNRLQIAGDRIDPLLSVKQWLFLAGVLRCEGSAPTLSEVAARIGSSRQNVKKTALILERRGFVLMEKDLSDARVLRIRLTEACAAHLLRREERERRFIEELFCGIGGEELSAFRASLQKLEENVGRMERGDEARER
ncbi:MAG TPA: MarR family transcriptional regulator [Oscillospiraceae bacterium]|nr:MarR family transcriptional regulator [Oscillospiraceae bacterium]HNW04989.1 MarR family transcriptional regulator [Oscillospiraceae bacterium]HPV99938.1 MarR family transcriptional regulator [Oscillospiraceae bacterium]